MRAGPRNLDAKLVRKHDSVREDIPVAITLGVNPKSPARKPTAVLP